MGEMINYFVIQNILCRYSPSIKNISNIIPNNKLCEIEVIYGFKYNIIKNDTTIVTNKSNMANPKT